MVCSLGFSGRNRVPKLSWNLWAAIETTVSLEIFCVKNERQKGFVSHPCGEIKKNFVPSPSHLYSSILLCTQQMCKVSIKCQALC